jgi:RNA-directed DNA polymerase
MAHLGVKCKSATRPECEDDAHRFMRVLPLRLGKFGLRLNAQKTGLLGGGQYYARQALWHGKRPPTFDFLGFTPYWGRTQTGGSTVNRGHEHHRLIRSCSAREGRPRRFGGTQRDRGT